MNIRTAIEGMRFSFVMIVLVTPGVPVHGQIISRVSVASDGTQANSSSNPGVSISADNRYVAFKSAATNLVPSDTNGAVDIFVHDRITLETTLVSVASDGDQGSLESAEPSLSGDGRYVAFVSWSSNLVLGDNNNSPDAFIHDRLTGETELASKATNGTFGNDWTDVLAMSSDGRYVAFVSDSTNLVSGDTNNRADVFLHDRVTGVTTRVSVASDGSQAIAGVSHTTPAISETGRYVAFASWSTLVPGDTNGTDDIFIHDRVTGQTTLASVSTVGQVSNSTSSFPSISDDGNHVGFSSIASNLVPNDTNGSNDIFVHDRVSETTNRVSVASNGGQGNGFSSFSALSADGRHVAFSSGSSNFVPNDTNNETDNFVHDQLSGKTIRVNLSRTDEEADDSSFGPVDISAAGSLHVTFNSRAENLVPADTNNFMDVFLVSLFFFDGFESGDTSAWSSTVP